MNKVFLPFLFIVLFSLCSTVEGSDWISLGKDTLGTTYYDNDSIKQLSRGIVRVSVKIAYSSEGVSEFREAFPHVKPVETISYTLYVYEVNCAKGLHRLIKAATYNSSESVIKGTELDYIETGQASRELITPNSMMAFLAEASCKYQLYDREFNPLFFDGH